MALEAVVISQAAGGGHFGYGLPWCDPLLGSGGGGAFSGDLCAGDCWDHELDAWTAPAPGDDYYWEAAPVSNCMDQSSDASTEDHHRQGGHRAAGAAEAGEPPAAAAGRRKRRRAKVVKNQEEIETQRMTHIAVERNRRRQMNEYLAVLRSLMPPSYAHRGDQASIVGGAINYVRELEQLLQSLQVQRSVQQNRSGGGTDAAAAATSPFAGFFSFPQYSTTSTHGCCSSTSIGGSSCNNTSNNNGSDSSDASSGSAEGGGRPAPAIADIEVTMVEGHASLKVLVRRQPTQLLKLVAGLHQLRIPPLHLNMTSVDAMVLYTFSLKVEDDSKMGSVEDIATAVHEILGTMENTAVM